MHRLVDGSAGGRLARLAAAMILRAAVTAVVARLRTEPPGEDADEDEDEDSGEVVPSL